MIPRAREQWGRDLIYPEDISKPSRILQHTPILQGSLKVFRQVHHPEPDPAPNSAPSSNDVPENIEASWFNT